MNRLSFILVLIILLSVYACKPTQDVVPDPTPTPTPTPEEMQQSSLDTDSILSLLANNYMQMPENEIAISKDKRVFAQYAAPTQRYTHGIMGDAIEAAQLVVVVDGNFYELELNDNYVFEDIRPRLANVDDDEALEFICIRTHVNKGAGIAIYKLGDTELYQYAFVPEIGTRNRWLNIVAIQNLDDEAAVELAWIETPHIGGILKVAKIMPGELQLIDEASQYSNHSIGETNLCLSVVVLKNATSIIYVPSQNRKSIAGFTFQKNKWAMYDTIFQPVNFSIPLIQQYNFLNAQALEDNCIAP